MTSSEPGVVVLREERKVVTALFADLVGSTALGEVLDAEELKLVVGDAVARIVTEVEHLGGHVKDLAGDGVLALFGAPVSSEDDPERAVRAGLAVVEEVGAYAREVEQSWSIQGFGVRVGIATGPVALGPIGAGSRVEYAAFGDTVNIAARLQDAADPQSVLADATTYRHTADLFDWDGPARLALKGKADPVATYVATAMSRGAAGRRAPDHPTTPIAGRERELSAAAELVERLRLGTGAVLVVTGEAGIGKSRLLRELRARAESPDDGAPPALWLEGRCVSYGESLPWWPFRELIRDWLGAALDDPDLRVRIALRRTTDELFGVDGNRCYPYLAALLGIELEPEVAARLADLSPEALQYRTLEVVGEVVARLAETRPVVVAIEDLHWADATSVQQVERLLAVSERSAVLLAIAMREAHDHPSWSVNELAQRDYPHLTVTLPLEPLSSDAETALLHALVDEGTMPPSFERRLLDAADGNPFFLEELVSSLADHGALIRENGRWRFDHETVVELPPTVEKVIVARIDRLPEDTRGVLTAASAVGRTFGLDLLAHVAGVTEVEEALHTLQRVDLVRAARRWPQPEYRFKHALIQEAAYRTLLVEQRRALHRRAAEWFERRLEEGDSEPLGLLAHHWLAAEDEAKATEFLLRAGDRARAEWALDEAVEHYRALLPLLERRGERQAMALTLFRLGLAQHMSLRFADANITFQRAFGLWSPPLPHDSPSATLRIATALLARQPDPPRSYSLPDIELQMALLDRLVERWPEATIVPWLAERWEIADDGLRYVFHLRDGLQWSDGVPLTAHDVEYGIKRNLDPGRPGISVSLFTVLEGAQEYALGRTTDSTAIGVRALDELTVEFRLVAPAPYFLSLLNRPDAGPQPRHAIEAYGDAWIDPEHQVVSGAFRQLERAPERIVLERRSGATARAGNVGRVEILPADPDRAHELFRSGDVDLVVTGVARPMLELLDAAEAVLGPPAWAMYLAFDHSDPRFARRDARLAFAHAIDRKALAAVLPRTIGVAGGGIVPPALQGHTPDIVPRFDPELARDLLAESGFTGGLTLAAPRGSLLDGMCQTVVETWRSILDIDASWNAVEFEQWLSAPSVWSLGDVAGQLWFPGYPDAEYYLRLLLHSDSTDNVGRYADADFDSLIERARAERDGSRRLELFHAADRMAIAEHAAVIPLGYASNAVVTKPWLTGWWEYGKSWSGFADLVLDEEARRTSLP